MPASHLPKTTTEQVTRYADMFSAMGTEARLRIMQLLLSAHPKGLVVGEIQEELGIPNSTLSHHLDKLRNEGLVQVRRDAKTGNDDLVEGQSWLRAVPLNKFIDGVSVATLRLG